MIGSVRIALISPVNSGFGLRLMLEDCEVVERDEKLCPCVDLTTDEAAALMEAMTGMFVQATCRNAK